MPAVNSHTVERFGRLPKVTQIENAVLRQFLVDNPEDLSVRKEVRDGWTRVCCSQQFLLFPLTLPLLCSRSLESNSFRLPTPTYLNYKCNNHHTPRFPLALLKFSLLTFSFSMMETSPFCLFI